MPRTIQITASASLVDAVQRRIQELPDVAGLSRHIGASVNPPGDILVVNVSNDVESAVFSICGELKVHQEGSIHTSQPLALITSQNADSVEQEGNEAVWEEMAFHLYNDTNVDFNYTAMMLLAGAVAAVGLWADMLHIVLGAMVIAPAYEPLVRLPFGLIAGPRRVTTGGVWSALIGYLVMALGGLATVWIMRAVDPQASLDLTSRHWVQYWSSFSGSGVVVSAFASVAGAVIISGLRSVMTTGVMIALALIPSMTIVGMAVAVGDWQLAGGGLARWAADAGLVVLCSALVLGAKQKWYHRRNSLN